MPVLTRSQAKRRIITNDQSSSPQSSSSPSEKTPQEKNKKNKEEYNRTVCENFVANPTKNPFTGNKIEFLGPSFYKYNEMCKQLYGISYDINKHVQDILDNDIVIGILFKISIKMNHPQPAEVKDIFKNPKTRTYVRVSDYDYLQYAFNYVNTFQYNNKIQNYILDKVRNNKVALLEFINNIQIHPQRSHKKSTIEINGKYIEIFDYQPVYIRIIDNARINNIVAFELPAYMNHDNPTEYCELQYHDNRVFLKFYMRLRQYLVDFIMHEDQPIDKLERIFDVCDEMLERDYIYGAQDKIDFQEILRELESILDKKNQKSKSITNMSTARSSNRNKSISPQKKIGLPPLPEYTTRDDLLTYVKDHSTADVDMITLRNFDDFKKKDLQLVVRIGPPNKDTVTEIDKTTGKSITKPINKYHTYSVVSIYKHIKSNVKAGLVPKDPLNPAYAITTDEIRDIHLKMQYYRKGAPSPDAVLKSTYPKVYLLFNPSNHYEGFYEIIIKHTIGTVPISNRIWGYIPDIDSSETGRPDLNTGIIFEKLRKLHDEGRLLEKTYTGPDSTLKFVPRVHINKSAAYWNEDRIRKLQLMADEVNTYYVGLAAPSHSQ